MGARRRVHRRASRHARVELGRPRARRARHPGAVGRLRQVPRRVHFPEPTDEVRAAWHHARGARRRAVRRRAGRGAARRRECRRQPHGGCGRAAAGCRRPGARRAGARVPRRAPERPEASRPRSTSRRRTGSSRSTSPGRTRRCATRTRSPASGGSRDSRRRSSSCARRTSCGPRARRSRGSSRMPASSRRCTSRRVPVTVTSTSRRIRRRCRRSRRSPSGSRRSSDDDAPTFTNPVLAGDRPDPAVIKVGDEYWMTYSSFEAAPGLLLYRSTDLVNWTYETSALPNPVGNTFAVDIAEHDGRFFIYIPFIPTPWSTLTDASIFVIHAAVDERSVVGADRPRHPRSDRPRPRRRRGRQAVPVHQRGAPHPARRRRAVDGGRAREGLRRLAVPRRVDHRGVRARGAEALPARTAGSTSSAPSAAPAARRPATW